MCVLACVCVLVTCRRPTVTIPEDITNFYYHYCCWHRIWTVFDQSRIDFVELSFIIPFGELSGRHLMNTGWAKEEKNVWITYVVPSVTSASSFCCPATFITRRHTAVEQLWRTLVSFVANLQKHLNPNSPQSSLTVTRVNQTQTKTKKNLTSIGIQSNSPFLYANRNLFRFQSLKPIQWILIHKPFVFLASFKLENLAEPKNEIVVKKKL